MKFKLILGAEGIKECFYLYYNLESLLYYSGIHINSNITVTSPSAPRYCCSKHFGSTTQAPTPVRLPMLQPLQIILQQSESR